MNLYSLFSSADFASAGYSHEARQRELESKLFQQQQAFHQLLFTVERISHPNASEIS